MDKCVEYAALNRAIGRSTRAERRQDLEDMLDGPEESSYLATSLTSDRYNELAGECNDLIRLKKYTGARRVLTYLSVPKTHAKRVVFDELCRAIIRRKQTSSSFQALLS